MAVNVNINLDKKGSEELRILVENYIQTLKEFKNEDFKIFNLDDIKKSQKMIWVICYEPIVGFNCTLPNDKNDTWILIETKQNHFLNSKLYRIN